jgi:gamma-glutamylcyclotransferase (GGCT)/AIG2-like uncharacterized protein YtfP
MEPVPEERDEADMTLAVYGSLAPGQVNHHVVASIAGRWSTAEIEAVWVARGWGSSLGYHALEWRPAAPRQTVHVLHSEQLPLEWRRLDAFEGSDYVRVRVPLKRGLDNLGFASMYTAKPLTTSDR